MAAMGPVLAAGSPNQSEGRFVNQSSRLQRVARWLVGQAGGGETTQLGVDKREQIHSSLSIPGRGSVQKYCHIGHLDSLTSALDPGKEIDEKTTRSWLGAKR